MSAPHTPQTASSSPASTSDVVKMVRRRDRVTSWDAAAAQTDGRRAELQRAIYRLLDLFGPLTHEQLIDRLGSGVTPSGVRSRCAELVEAGWVADSGDRRRTRAGSRAIAWQALDAHDPAPVPEPSERDGWRQPTPGGLVAAHARGQWEGVDADLVELILRAYLNPRRDLALLEREQVAGLDYADAEDARADERGEQ